jgi:hypothetical protein
MCDAGMCCIVVSSAVSHFTFCNLFEASYGQRRRLMGEIKIHIMEFDFEGWT